VRAGGKLDGKVERFEPLRGEAVLSDLSAVDSHGQLRVVDRRLPAGDETVSARHGGGHDCDSFGPVAPDDLVELPPGERTFDRTDARHDVPTVERRHTLEDEEALFVLRWDGGDLGEFLAVADVGQGLLLHVS